MPPGAPGAPGAPWGPKGAQGGPKGAQGALALLLRGGPQGLIILVAVALGPQGIPMVGLRGITGPLGPGSLAWQ